MKTFYLLILLSSFSLRLYAQGEKDILLEELLAQESQLNDKMAQLQQFQQAASDLPKNLENDKDYIRKWNQSHKDYGIKVDEFSKFQYDFLLEDTDQKINDHFEKLAASSDTNDQKKLALYRDKYFEILQNLKKDYYANLQHYGKGKDYKRITPFRKYFIFAKKMAQEIQDIDSNFSHKLETCQRYLSRKMTDLKRLALLPQKLKIFSILKSTPAKAPKNHTPLVNALERYSQIEGIIDGYQYQVNNLNSDYPYLKKETQDDNKRINIFAISHMAFDADRKVFANLQLPSDHFLFFAAYAGGLADQPKYIPQLIDQSHDVIVVGGPNDPMDKINGKIKNGVSSNIVVFPQGWTPVFGEILPVREKSLWDQLRLKGLTVDITPVTVDIPDRFLKDVAYMQKSDNVVTTTIHPTIKDEEYSQMLEATDGDNLILNRYLRSLWIETIQNNPPLSTSEILSRIQSDILDKLY